MVRRPALRLVVLATVLAVPLTLAGSAFQGNQAPKVAIPEPGVPQIMTMEGAYVRAAYNNEGYVILGYRAANASVGTEWLLLEIGTTMRSGKPAYTLKREDLTLDAPEKPNIPLASVEDFRAANLMALKKRNEVMRDSINYFPPSAYRACRIGFFSELSGPALPWDVVELSSDRACLGQMYFKVPGGIAYGQHWFNVKFPSGVVRVPFRILTKEEDKMLSKNYKNIKKQVEDAFKSEPKPKK